MTRSNQGLSVLAPGGGKMRDHGNEVVCMHACGSVLLAMVLGDLSCCWSSAISPNITLNSN